MEGSYPREEADEEEVFVFTAKNREESLGVQVWEMEGSQHEKDVDFSEALCVQARDTWQNHGQMFALMECEYDKIAGPTCMQANVCGIWSFQQKKIHSLRLHLSLDALYDSMQAFPRVVIGEIAAQVKTCTTKGFDNLGDYLDPQTIGSG